MLEKSAGNPSATFQQQFRLRAVPERRHAQHPLARGKAESDSPRFAYRSHEIAIGQWRRRGDIHNALNLLMLNQVVHRPREILVVNPGHVLLATSRGPA